MAQTFFYLKVDIKSKLFTDANLSMTQKKNFTPIYTVNDGQMDGKTDRQMARQTVG